MHILTFLLLGLLAWYIWDSLNAKAVAIDRGQRICSTYDVQFLDETVAATRTRLRRDGHGRMAVYRRFDFEFSGDGASRHHGYIELLGRRVTKVELEPYRIDPV